LEEIKSGGADGMQHFDGELAKLVRGGVVDVETAAIYATDPREFRQGLA
jgi:Tfp pilus assembly pilus retraction ATPase PilT